MSLSRVNTRFPEMFINKETTIASCNFEAVIHLLWHHERWASDCVYLNCWHMSECWRLLSAVQHVQSSAQLTLGSAQFLFLEPHRSSLHWQIYYKNAQHKYIIMTTLTLRHRQVTLVVMYSNQAIIWSCCYRTTWLACNCICLCGSNGTQCCIVFTYFISVKIRTAVSSMVSG